MDHLATASLTSLWDEVSGIQPDPDLWVVVATLVAALAVVATRGSWRDRKSVV